MPTPSPAKKRSTSWPAASAVFATRRPRAARVGFSGPVAIWTRSLDTIIPPLISASDRIVELQDRPQIPVRILEPRHAPRPDRRAAHLGPRGVIRLEDDAASLELGHLSLHIGDRERH